MTMLEDPVPVVRATAVRSLRALLGMVTFFPPSDSNIFLLYIFPALQVHSRVRVFRAELVWDVCSALSWDAGGGVVRGVAKDAPCFLTRGHPRLLVVRGETLDPFDVIPPTPGISMLYIPLYLTLISSLNRDGIRYLPPPSPF